MFKSNIIPLIILLLSLLNTFASPALSSEPITPPPIVGNSSDKLGFSKAERDWLAQNHVLHVRVGDYAPIQLFNQKPSGIAVDYLNAIAEKIGIQVEYRKEVHWADTLNKIRDHGGVDLLLGAMWTQERSKYLTFTNTYLSFPSVIFTREDSNFVSSLQDLSGKIVAVQNKVVVHGLLVERYPDLKLLLKATEKDALFSLVTGESDAYVGNLTVGSFYIQANGWNNVKVAAPTGFDPQSLSMAVRSDWPELAGIIDKTLTTFTPAEHMAMRSDWSAPIRYEYGISGLDIVKWVVGISSFLVVIIGIILWWNKRLTREIAARTIAEAKLVKSKERYRGLYNNNPLPYQSLNEDGCILDVNPTWLTFLGYEREEVIDKHYTKFLHPESQQIFSENFPKLKQLGCVKAVEFQLKHKDGHFIDISLNGSVGYGEDGNIDRTYCVFHNITERKKAQKALLESEGRFRNLSDATSEAIVFHDKGFIFHANNQYYKMFGYTPEELTGVDALLLTTTSDSFKFIQRKISAGDFGPYETTGLKKDGTEFPMQLRSKISEFHPEKTRMVTIRDLTEQKQAEVEKAKLESQLQQAHKMEAIGTLAGGIAHDFNNILGAIIGYTEMARDDSPKESSVARDLDKVLEASDRAAGLVKQILSFSRQDETEQILLQPSSIVIKAVSLLRPTLPTTIEITQDIGTKTGFIFADPSQIHQILMNLCTNAFHAMEEKGGRLDISLKEIDLCRENILHEPNIDPGTFVQLSVSDTGPGMTQEIKDKIFDPFFTTKEVGKGTGMGLSIVHGIIKSYGGFITLSSELGKGTTFHIFLPVVNTDKAVLPDKDAIKKIPIGNEKILFIDDEQVLADMGKNMLERLGYQVTLRKSSLEALETFQNQPDQFDVVITDQTMPGMTGVDLARRMLQIRPDIPIILCTGYSSTISETKAKSIGIREFALKPLAKKDIAQLIRKVLEM